MIEPSLSLEAKAHYAAQILAEHSYRDSPCWYVSIVKKTIKTYGTPPLAKLLPAEDAVKESLAIEVSARSIVIFTAEEAYLIARSLVEQG